MRVKFIGVEPKIVPVEPRQGWYMISVDAGTPVATVLNRFGLKAGALSVMRNGSLADSDEFVDDQDELQILLKTLGG